MTPFSTTMSVAMMFAPLTMGVAPERSMVRSLPSTVVTVAPSVRSAARMSPAITW